MRLITRCPHCSTLFKAVPDQFRVAQGWVRCGQCSEVFDALQSMLTSEPEATATSVSTGASAASLIEAHPLLPNAPLSAPLSGAGLPFQTTQTATPFFLMSATRTLPPAWTHMVMGILALLLALAVLVQYAYFERDQLAAWHVEFKPVLTKLCRFLNCKILPVQDSASIVVESATLTHLGQDGYRLSFVVKNTASIKMAVPHVEVTLTDLTDQAIVRRVLTPRELGATSPTLQATADWQVSVVMQVKSVLRGNSVMGYRLVAFYP